MIEKCDEEAARSPTSAAQKPRLRPKLRPSSIPTVALPTSACNIDAIKRHKLQYPETKDVWDEHKWGKVESRDGISLELRDVIAQYMDEEEGEASG